MDMKRNGHTAVDFDSPPHFWPEFRTSGARAQEVMDILLVDSNFDHIRLVDKVLRDCLGEYTLTVAADGVEATALFKPYSRYGGSTKPDLILLEAGLRKKDGYEVLFEIKADDALAAIPVVVLSSSDDDDDVDIAYALGANCYVVKPPNVHDFISTIGSVIHFWRTVARLPDSRLSAIDDQIVRRTGL